MVKIYAFVTFCLLWMNAQAWDAGYTEQHDEHAVYVQTDKEFYFTGEIIWFRVFFLNMQPLFGNGSDVAYVEVINQEGVPVIRARVETGVAVSSGGSLSVPNELPTGTYRLYGYTEALKRAGESAFFQKQIRIFNPFISQSGNDAPQLQMETSTVSPSMAGKLHVDVQLRDSSLAVRQNATFSLATRVEGKPVAADVAVSIVKIDALQPFEREGIASYLRADHKQTISGAVNDVPRNVDSLKGKQMVAVTYLDATGNEPLAGRDVFVSFPGFHFELYPAQTDEFGTAYFYTDRLQGNLMLTTGLFSGDRSTIELQSPYWQHYEPTDVNQFPYIPTEELLDRSIQVQAENLYRLDERSQFSAADKDTIPFYGEADVTYRLDDYTRFPTMEEILREYVTEIRVSRHQHQFNLRVLDGTTRYFYSERPLLLFNGLPVADVSALMDFDPKRVAKIDIVANQYYFGGNIYDGVVNFCTYDGGLGGFTLDASVTVLDYEGIQVDRKFFTPDYSSADAVQSRFPDMRNVLYWNPRVITDARGIAEIPFSTSDIPGTYLISIDGIDNEGNVGSQRMMFTVR